MKLRKAITILSLLGAVGVLAACGPSTTTDSSGDSSGNDWEVPADYKAFEGDPEELKTTIEMWHTFGESSSPNYNNLKAIVTEFQNRYPNITVNIVNHSSYDTIYTDLRYAVSAGTLPTMAIAYPDHVADYLESGVVENMAGYVFDPTIGLGIDDDTEAGPIDDYYSGYLDESTDYARAGVYSMPWSKSTEVMFYNKTNFDEYGLTVPRTWEDLWEVCAQIKDIDPDVIPFGYDSDDNLFITRLAQDNIPYTSLDANNHFLFNNADAKAMVQELKTNYDLGYLTTKGTSANGSYTSTMFTNQELWMTVGSTGGTSYNYTSNFEIGIAAVPQSDTENSKVISQGPSVCFFSSASQDQLYAAWLFYKFATNANNTANLSTLTGYNPVRRSAFETEYYKNWASQTATQGSSKLIRDALEFADDTYANAYFTSPAFRGSATCRTEVGGIITNVLLGTLSVDEAFSKAYANAVIAGN